MSGSREWAGRFVPASGLIRTMTLLDSMTRGIKKQFVYLRRIEKGVQGPAETLERGSGSCRDFALLMMEAVRALGLAARFVSGYIFVPRVPSCGHGGRRLDTRLDAGLPAGRGLGRFRSDQQHRRQSESDSRGGRLGSRARAAAVGQLHRFGLVVSRDGCRR